MSRFNLPVFQGGTDATLDEILRLSLRAEEIFDATLGERINLDLGAAIISDEFPDIPAANQIRDITPPPPSHRPPEDILAEVDALFAARSRRCHSWIFADARVPSHIRPLLERRGYIHASRNLLRSLSPPRLHERTDLTIIPGRASFEKLADLFDSAHTFKNDSIRMQFRLATSQRLDDTRIDNLLALDGTLPVGTLYFVTLGQLGFITQFYVHPDHHRRRIGSTLLARALELGARSRVRNVTLFCDADNHSAQPFYQKAGFALAAEVESMESVG